jgi:hypothetical protein
MNRARSFRDTGGIRNEDAAMTRSPAHPSAPGRTPSGPFELMAITRSGISPRLLAHFAARRREGPEPETFAPRLP